jgi:hypothetical protein
MQLSLVLYAFSTLSTFGDLTNRANEERLRVEFVKFKEAGLVRTEQTCKFHLKYFFMFCVFKEKDRRKEIGSKIL